MNKLIQTLKNRYHWSNKIHVASAAHFLCEGTLFKTHIRIDGHNTVTIGKRTKMLKIELVVSGEDNLVRIGNDCYFENDAPAKAAAFED